MTKTRRKLFRNINVNIIEQPGVTHVTNRSFNGLRVSVKVINRLTFG